MADPDNDDDEIMTIADLASYLHLSPQTVSRMARRGEIPATKVAHQWRFVRTLVRQWLAKQIESQAANTGPSGDAAAGAADPGDDNHGSC